ncbi:MAG: ABC transporter substrate-binding protein [Spirulinaceae cyanobacterium]
MKKILSLKRRRFLKLSSMAVGSSILAACNRQSPSEVERAGNTEKLDKIEFILGWKAEAEYGGFFQAVATGIYEDYGLDVNIQATAPQTNTTQLLVGGLADFMMGHSVNALKSIQQGIPTVTVAAIFQQELQVLLAHPDTGVESLKDLRGKPIYLTPGANTTYWPVLKEKYGFDDSQQRPYNFNVSPFLLDKNAAQQGILTSEPYTIEKEGGFKPVILPLSEAGYNPYAFTIETTQKLVTKNPDLVQRFVTASIQGWYSYLEDPTPGNELIKQANPEMSDDLLAYGVTKLKEYGISTSGDAVKLGIGAMSDGRWQSLFEELVAVGVLDDKTNYQDAYTLDFVNQGVEFFS